MIAVGVDVAAADFHAEGGHVHDARVGRGHGYSALGAVPADVEAEAFGDHAQGHHDAALFNVGHVFAAGRIGTVDPQGEVGGVCGGRRKEKEREGK